MLIHACKLKGVELRAIKMKNETGNNRVCMEVAHTAGLAFCLVLKTKARTNKKAEKMGAMKQNFIHTLVLLFQMMIKYIYIESLI